MCAANRTAVIASDWNVHSFVRESRHVEHIKCEDNAQNVLQGFQFQ